jgi:hypothetical protein
VRPRPRDYVGPALLYVILIALVVLFVVGNLPSG